MLGFSGNREWVYAKSIKGFWQKVHRGSGLVFQLGLVVLPWIYVAGHPAVRVDLPDRRLYLFGTVFTSADTFILMLLALLAAFGLFFFTTLFGRVWCGYVCPQTVMLEEWVRPIEQFFEGDRSKRRHRDSKPWTFDTAWRKVGKWTAFLAVAFLMAASITAYFSGAYEFWSGTAGSGEYLIAGIITTGLFIDFAWFREQLCNYVCPYARFQGALTDKHSLVISYDVARGEPRMKGKASAQAGTCIDCNKCVVVCPQGIDIRDGYQLECISCARCIDACTSVMDRLGHPTLVKYTTEAIEQGERFSWIRGRTVAYGGLLTVLTVAIATLVINHSPIEMMVNRAPGTLFQVDGDGTVRNTYMVRLTNNDTNTEPKAFTFRVEGLPAAILNTPPVQLGATSTTTVPLAIKVPRALVNDRTLTFDVIVEADGREVRKPATFKAPPPGAKGVDHAGTR